MGYRSCLGLVSLGGKHGAGRLEAAAARALHFGAFSLASIKSILQHHLEREPLPGVIAEAPPARRRSFKHPRRGLLRFHSVRTVMLNQQTLHKLYVMRLNGMADAFRQQLELTRSGRTQFRRALRAVGRSPVELEGGPRPGPALAQLQAAKHGPAWKTSITRPPRGLDRALLRSLAAESEWVKQHLNIFLIGATGVGKSWLAGALAHKACRDGYTVYYARAAQLFRDLSLAHADGSFSRLLRRLAQTDVLVIDDWAMAPLTDPERRDFLEICDDRYQTRSTILTSQVPVANWHAQIGDPTAAATASSTGWCTTPIESN